MADPKAVAIEAATKALQDHLPVKVADDDVLCLCDVTLIFDGPVFQRQHAAEFALDAILKALRDSFGEQALLRLDGKIVRAVYDGIGECLLVGDPAHDHYSGNATKCDWPEVYRLVEESE